MPYEFHKMVDMELDDESKLDAPMPIAMNSKPDYPYGLRISLTNREMKKLDLDPDYAEVGGIVHLSAMARITSVSHNTNGPDGYNCCVELQIEDLAVHSEDKENAEYEDGEYDDDGAY